MTDKILYFNIYFIFTIKMSESILTIKRIYVNKLGFPSELSDLIKDFIFLDCVSSFAKNTKNKIIEFIKEGNSLTNESDAYFAIEIMETISDRIPIQFQSGFCRQCGNYIYFSANGVYTENAVYTEKIFCNC